MKNNHELLESVYKKVDERKAKTRKKHVVLTRIMSCAVSIVVIASVIIVHSSLHKNDTELIAQKKTTSQSDAFSKQTVDSAKPKATAGNCISYPHITFNNKQFNISLNIKGNDPSKFVDKKLGTVKGYFVFDSAGKQQTESDNIYSVNGFDEDFVICAKTSVGWEFFKTNANYSNLSGASNAYYGATGMNLKTMFNQVASASYKLASFYGNTPQNQSEHTLSLSQTDLTSLANYLISTKYSDIPGSPASDYILYFTFANGTTISFDLYEYENASYICSDSFNTQLNAQFNKLLATACNYVYEPDPNAYKYTSAYFYGSDGYDLQNSLKGSASITAQLYGGKYGQDKHPVKQLNLSQSDMASLANYLVGTPYDWADAGYGGAEANYCYYLVFRLNNGKTLDASFYIFDNSSYIISDNITKLSPTIAKMLQNACIQ